MSEVKFSRGPWKVDAGFDGNEGDFEQYWQVHDGQDAIACSSFCFAGNRRANAHLIAAAPDLYEALEKIMKMDLSWGYDKAMGKSQQIAQMALAKARGE